MALVTKRAGAPAGTIKASVGGNVYTFDDAANVQVDVTDSKDYSALIAHPYFQAAGGGGVFVPSPFTGPLSVGFDGTEWPGEVPMWQANGSVKFTSIGGADLTVPQAVGDGVADATSTIQAILNAARDAGGGHIYVPRGTYLISSDLLIYSNTTLELHPAATIKRNNLAVGSLIRSAGAPSPTASYVNPNAQNITICGGNWDGNRVAFPSNHNGISFGYGTNIVVRDTTVKNVFGWHHLEFHGSRRVLIDNVTCDGINDQSISKEMLQIDVTNVAGGPSSWYNGIGDGLPNIDFKVRGCTFQNGARGIGSHSRVPGSLASRFKISNCHFENMGREAIEAYQFAEMAVSGCTFLNCQKGIHVWANEGSQEHAISNNIFRTMTGGPAILVENEGGGSLLKRVGNMELVGNVVRGVTGVGIDINNAFGVQLVGNDVRESTVMGLRALGVNVLTATGNQVRANTGTVDVSLGRETGSADTQSADYLIVGNTFGALQIATGTRFQIANNNILVSYATTATAGTLIQRLNNFIAGTWTP